MSRVTLDPQKAGDDWDGIASVSYIINNVAQDLTGSLIRMQVKTHPRSPEWVAQWTTTDGSIQITDALNGLFRVVGRKIDFAPGLYAWDIEVTLATGKTKTVADGRWRITQDVTR